MAILRLIQGDLFTANADAIGHGTNTKGKMGAGIAVLFKKKFPKMHDLYVELCDTFGDELGGRTYLYYNDNYSEQISSTFVANIFSQKKTGGNAEVGLLISALKDAYMKLRFEAEIEAPHLAIPLIGCDIGGLDWTTEVRPAIEELMAELPENWKLTVYSLIPREDFVVIEDL